MFRQKAAFMAQLFELHKACQMQRLAVEEVCAIDPQGMAASAAAAMVREPSVPCFPASLRQRDGPSLPCHPTSAILCDVRSSSSPWKVVNAVKLPGQQVRPASGGQAQGRRGGGIYLHRLLTLSSMHPGCTISIPLSLSLSLSLSCLPTDRCH